MCLRIEYCIVHIQHDETFVPYEKDLQMLAGILLLAFAPICYAQGLQDLGRDFWRWRANEQPFSVD